MIGENKFTDKESNINQTNIFSKYEDQIINNPFRKKIISGRKDERKTQEGLPSQNKTHVSSNRVIRKYDVSNMIKRFRHSPPTSRKEREIQKEKEKFEKEKKLKGGKKEILKDGNILPRPKPETFKEKNSNLKIEIEKIKDSVVYNTSPITPISPTNYFEDDFDNLLGDDENDTPKIQPQLSAVEKRLQELFSENGIKDVDVFGDSPNSPKHSKSNEKEETTPLLIKEVKKSNETPKVTPQESTKGKEKRGEEEDSDEKEGVVEKTCNEMINSTFNDIFESLTLDGFFQFSVESEPFEDEIAYSYTKI